MLIAWLIFLLIKSFHSICVAKELMVDEGSSLRERLQKNPKLPPSLHGETLQVHAGFYIESMGKFQATDMSFNVDLYLYMSWKDPSLRHNNPEYILITRPKEVVKMIWMPDLYFANARTSNFHDVTIPNFSMFIAQDGTIGYSTRITLNVACNLNLVNYPMDSQVCKVQMLSYAYVDSQVNVSWFGIIEAIRYNKKINLPEFRIDKIRPEYCDGEYYYAIMENSYKYNRFSCLEAAIYLERQIGYHLVQTFIPTSLIVMISWVSFWIDRRAVPARVTLSFTTLLSLTTLGNGLHFGLPQVAYAKAIDYWFGACMFFVCASLLEFAAVNSNTRAADKLERMAHYHSKRFQINYNRKTKKQSSFLPPEPVVIRAENAFDKIDSPWKLLNNPILTPRIVRSPMPDADLMAENGAKFDQSPDNEPKSKKYQNFRPYDTFLQEALHYSQIAMRIDKWSRLFFPLAFLIHNCLYWTYYLRYIKE